MRRAVRHSLSNKHIPQMYVRWNSPPESILGGRIPKSRNVVAIRHVRCIVKFVVNVNWLCQDDGNTKPRTISQPELSLMHKRNFIMFATSHTVENSLLESEAGRAVFDCLIQANVDPRRIPVDTIKEMLLAECRYRSTSEDVLLPA